MDFPKGDELTDVEKNNLSIIKGRAWKEVRVAADDGYIQTQRVDIQDRILHPEIAHTIDHQPVTSDRQKLMRTLKRATEDLKRRLRG